MKIKEMPFFNRPGFKLTKNGANSLDTAELLSIIFGIGSREESALELSNRLLKRHNLHELENLGFNELKTECKGDAVKAMKLLSVVELGKRYNKLINNGYKTSIKSPEDVYSLLGDELKQAKQEYFICLYLDTKNRIIKQKTIFIGTLNSTAIHPREIFKEAIKESANSIILVHNHPSGDPKPSEEDKRLTKELINIGELLDIKISDHVIVGKNTWWSWASN